MTLPQPPLAIDRGDPRIFVRRFTGRKASVVQGLHLHPFLEVVLIESGCGTQVIGGTKVTSRAGDVYVIAPGETHDADGLDSTVHWILAFDRSFFRQSVSNQGKQAQFPAFPDELVLLAFARPSGPSLVHFKLPKLQLKSWVEWLTCGQKELEGKSLGYAQATQAWVTLALVDLARRAAPSLPRFEAENRPHLARFFGAVEDRFAQKVSLKELARDSGLSATYLTDLLKRQTGKSAMEWVLERRLAEARRLLIETQKSIKEIAHEVGFADSSHFVRRFTEAHGATPKQWRNSR